MHPAFEIDAAIRGYLQGSSNLAELRSWFRVAFGALMELPPATTALELAVALQLALIEYDKGGFSERQVRQTLRRALSETVEAVIDSAPALTSSANVTLSGAGLASDPAPGSTRILTFQLTPTGTAS